MSQRKSKIQSKPQEKVTTPVDAVSLPFYVFLGFLIMYVPLFKDNEVLDLTLFPRLAAVAVFLTIFIPYFFIQKKGLIHEAGHAIFSPIMAILIAYLGSIILSQSLSAVPAEGFFDLVKNIAFTFVFFGALVLFTNKPEWTEKLPILVTFTAIIVLYIGYKQYWEKVLPGVPTLPDGRLAIYGVDGLESHKNEYANALMLMLPFLFYASYSFKSFWRWLSLGTLIALLTLIVLIKTRSVYLGVMVSFFIFTLAGAVLGERLGLAKTYRQILLAGLLIGTAGLIVVLSLPKDPNEFSFIGRIQSIFSAESGNNAPRLWIWKGTLQMIRDNFWTGVGPGGWNLNYYDYMSNVFTYISATNWGRPHNDFIWVAAEKGIIGITLYLAYFITLFWMCWRIIAASPHVKHRVFAMLLFGGLAAYITIACFSFPIERINHQMYLALYGAGITAMYYRIQEPSQKRKLPVGIIAILMPVLVFCSYYGFETCKMEKHVRLATAAMMQQNYPEVIKQIELARTPFRLIDNNSAPLDEFTSEAYYRMGKKKEAAEALDNALAIFPQKTILRNRKGQYLVEEQKYAEALVYFEKALLMVNTSKEIRINVSVCHFYLKNYDKALEALKGIPEYEKLPDVMERVNVLESVKKQEGL
jgi:O-antigen ligase